VKFVAVFIAAVLLALPAAAEFCDLDLRHENGRITWKPIAGATNYTVLRSYGGLKPPFYSSTKNTFIEVDHPASAPITVRYIVVAEIESGVRLQAGTFSDACTGSIMITLDADPAFRKFTRRAVIPVVGSTAGAMGGKFKTSLELRGDAQEHGRLIFHPAGKVASDDDPSIPYSFLQSRVLAWDDVVAAMGQSGIGSLDIVPDETSLDRIPKATVRLYNDTSIGTFGTFTSPLRPYDYLNPSGFEVRIPESKFRVNIGIRTLAETRMQALIYRADGRLDGFRDVTFPAGWMQMTSASDFIGRALEPGQTLLLTFTGASMPFYTITENMTNDPTLVIVPPGGNSRDVGEFVD
jgi:hypothetical protein